MQPPVGKATPRTSSSLQLLSAGFSQAWRQVSTSHDFADAFGRSCVTVLRTPETLVAEDSQVFCSRVS